MVIKKTSPGGVPENDPDGTGFYASVTPLGLLF